MFIQSLQTKNIFACHCTATNNHINCGLLAVKFATEKNVSLKDPVLGDRYTVEMPKWTGVQFGVQLKRVYDD